MDRRKFVKASAAAGVTLGLADQVYAQQESVPPAIRALKPMTAGIKPITDEERLARIEKARRLMRENRIDAVFLESGTSMRYFVNVSWGLSERPFGVIIPANGEIAYISPGFEEARARELIRFSKDVRVWQEDESPYKLIVDFVRERACRMAASASRSAFVSSSPMASARSCGAVKS
jgi:Xaa-Pro dipeptidase